MTDVEPLVTWDVRTPGWEKILGTDRHERLLRWLAGEGLDPRDIVRLEIYLVDCPYARVLERYRDEQGHVRLVELGQDDQGRMRYGDDVQMRDPYVVPLGSLPPDEVRP